MYAIIQGPGHQYRVEPGQFIRLPHLAGTSPGSKWKCQKVLAFGDSSGVSLFGTPFLNQVVVQGHVLRHGRSKKVLVFKKNRRKGYRRTRGHRQDFTEVYIESLKAPDGKTHTRPLKSPGAAQQKEKA